VIYRPDTQLSKASSVRTTRTFCLDLPLYQEASNYSSLHPSGRFSNTSGRHSVFDQLWDFFPKYRYGKIAATVRTMWIPVWTGSSIRQVAHSKFRRPDISLHGLVDHSLGLDVRSLDMEIACSWSATVRTRLKLGKNFNEILESRSHSCPFGRLMSTVQTTPRFIKPDDYLNQRPINRGP